MEGRTATVWSCEKSSVWDVMKENYEAILAQYSTKRSSNSKVPVVELDQWYRKDLRHGIKSRSPAFITKAELSKLMTWKLLKGKWRPKLQMYIDGLTDEEVIEASKQAFLELDQSKDNVRQAIKHLTQLKGVGPATASAVLAVYDASVPFMSDEALEAVAHVIGKRQYTLAHCLKFVDILREKATRLQGYTAQQVQLCLWAEKHSAGQVRDSDGQVPLKKKRRRI